MCGISQRAPQRGDIDHQRSLYHKGFYSRNRWRWVWRDDCRYRRRRLWEVLNGLKFNPEHGRILDVGFGTGDLLFTFPLSCSLLGVELSPDAVEAISADPRLTSYHAWHFEVALPDGSIPLPTTPVDLVLTSHVLEHVPDDTLFLRGLAGALKPGGLMVNFVPVEPEGFDPKHVRTYDANLLARRMEDAGLEILHSEHNYHINAGPMRWLDHPARHEWPLLTSLEGVRHALLSPIPYELTRRMEEVLRELGSSPMQALVVGRRPDGWLSTGGRS